MHKRDFLSFLVKNFKTTRLAWRFFYNVFGDYMKIYLDLLFLLNFGFDFLLLMTTSIVLKRKAKLSRIILGSVVGALSIFFLFLPLNSVSLFFLKFGVSILMLIISFGYHDLRYMFFNFIYLYFISIILGGFLYYLNVSFAYKQIGLVFFHEGFSINYVLLILLSPFVLYFYIKQNKKQRNIYNNIYDVCIIFRGCEYNYKGFLDSGNNLVDPYTHKPIIIIYDKSLSGNILVPISGIDGSRMMRCFKAKVFINDIKVNCLVGLSSQKINIDGVNCLINNRLGEYIC